MADDTSKQGMADRSRINLKEDYELRYWVKTLGVSADRLREAVSKVGSSVAAVRAHLGKPEKSN
jgi:hypothetical protein